MDKSKRRRLLIAAGATAGIAGIAGGAWWWLRTPRHEHPAAPVAPGEAGLPRDGSFPNALRVPGAAGLYGVIANPATLTLSAKRVRHEIIPGKPARLLAYETEFQGRRFLNPVLKVRSGARLRVNFWNGLDETSIIHWHGLKVDSNNDGHPHYAVPGGAIYDYHFTVANRAATYWYHPHPHHLTGKQVYLGLAGLFLVEDDDELKLQQALDLNLGATDIPLVLQDRQIDGNGELIFAPSREDRLHGYFGNEVLVNLTPRPHFDADTRIYRFRILNGSNARLFRLAFRHGGVPVPFQLIGNDGGLLDRPYTMNEAYLAPAERIDVLLDLRAAAPGDSITLASLAFDPMHLEGTGAAATGGSAGHAGHGGHGTPGTLADGAELDLLRIHVRRKIDYDRMIPHNLSRIDPVTTTGARPRVITLDHAKIGWRINGLTYDGKATPIVVQRGTTELWEVRNAARSMPHPMHIHGFQSQVIDRAGSPMQQARLAMAGNGLAPTDLGWKDTVLVWPGETVRVLTDFSHPFMGDQVYMVHCHNLEHEDGGMMLNLKVAA
jgi:blue copper oxidase